MVAAALLLIVIAAGSVILAIFAYILVPVIYTVVAVSLEFATSWAAKGRGSGPLRIWTAEQSSGNLELQTGTMTQLASSLHNSEREVVHVEQSDLLPEN